MRIALVCSYGGHLTELLLLVDAFKGHDIFFVTYKSLRTRKLVYRKYLLDNIGINIFRLIKAFFKMFLILKQEKPKLIVSTGAEIAIPAFYLAKLLKIKTIFIESLCRVKTASKTGKIVYPIADLFLVQWPNLRKVYGTKATFWGRVI